MKGSTNKQEETTNNKQNKQTTEKTPQEKKTMHRVNTTAEMKLQCMHVC